MHLSDPHRVSEFLSRPISRHVAYLAYLAERR
jgi:hypothetical protein